MRRRREMVGIALLGGLLASSATAALAHALIGLLGDAGIGGSAYAGHAHGAVGPLALAAVTVALAALLRSAFRSMRRSQANHCVEFLASRTSALRPLLNGGIVAIGGLTTLFAMEIGEQLSTLGRIEAPSDALGGNASIGIAIVFAVAATVTIVASCFARYAFSTAVAVVGTFLSWILATARAQIRATIAVPQSRRPYHFRLAVLACCFGMRAPPSSALV